MGMFAGLVTPCLSSLLLFLQENMKVLLGFICLIVPLLSLETGKSDVSSSLVHKGDGEPLALFLSWRLLLQLHLGHGVSWPQNYPPESLFSESLTLILCLVFWETEGSEIKSSG